MDRQKTLNSLKMALSGDTRKTWQYVLFLLRQLGHNPPEGEHPESWAIRKATWIVERETQVID